jgi:hypothetical protein
MLDIKIWFLRRTIKLINFFDDVHMWLRYEVLSRLDDFRHYLSGKLTTKSYQLEEVSYMKFVLHLLGFGLLVAVLFILGFLAGWVIAGGQLWTTL